MLTLTCTQLRSAGCPEVDVIRFKKILCGKTSGVVVKTVTPASETMLDMPKPQTAHAGDVLYAQDTPKVTEVTTIAPNANDATVDGETWTVLLADAVAHAQEFDWLYFRLVLDTAARALFDAAIVSWKTNYDAALAVAWDACIGLNMSGTAEYKRRTRGAFAAWNVGLATEFVAAYLSM
jgi:hypothetical protein